MESYTDDYCSYVLEQFEAAKQYAKDPTILLEQKLDFSKYVPDGFGTGDCVIVSDHLLHIIDFKYGKGVKVDATDNPQMKLYALGALEMFGDLYNIDEVETTIYQPRMANISTWSIPIKDLMAWANTTLKEKAELAFAGQGTVHYGPWCQFSNCNAVLRARYDYHHKLDRFQLASPHLLNDAEVAEVLTHADDLNRWVHDVKAYATDLAINHGKKWPGFKLVEGRSVRHYKDEATVAKIAEKHGYHDIYQKKLLPITKLEKQLGKKKLLNLRVSPPWFPILIGVRVSANQIRMTNSRRNNNMSKNTKVVTGINTRLSYANVWEPKSINGGKEKYSVSLIIPKDDTKTIQAINQAIDAAIEEGIGKFGGKKPNKAALKLPLRDGDIEKDDANYANSYFLNANSITAPQIVDKHVQPILDRDEVYSGCYARVSISFYAFNTNGNRGVACGLGNIQKIRDGEPLGGRSTAVDDFSTIDDEPDFLA